MDDLNKSDWMRKKIATSGGGRAEIRRICGQSYFTKKWPPLQNALYSTTDIFLTATTLIFTTNSWFNGGQTFRRMRFSYLLKYKKKNFK